MTTTVDIVNRALQAIGSQSTITTLTENSNEAIQANLVLTQLRDDLLRMAPWDCCNNYANLTYITSVPGTPENTSAGSTLWGKGVPAPPWSYEYQYPVDCMRALFIIPQFQTGFSGGIPITTAVTGGAPAWWNGPPAKFKVGIDQFFGVVSATVAAGGTGYNVGDVITLATGPTTSAPIGAPAQLRVLTAPAGVVATVEVVNNIAGASPAQSGSYFLIQPLPTPQAQGSVLRNGVQVTGGLGATFNLTYTSAVGSQRVILTNQEFATLCYNKQITDPNLMDPLFIDAWTMILASRLVIAISGDKALANMMIGNANNYIMEARKADGNEGTTINNVTPDWIRGRGIDFSDASQGPYGAFDWGNSFSMYS